MRNLKRLALELKILENVYGYDNVYYPEDGSWVKLTNYRLPPDEYNMSFCTVLVLIPKAYDDAEVTECYIDKDLRCKKNSRLVNLPHSYKKKFSGEGYQWICFEPSECKKSNAGLLDFVNTLRTYLCDPWTYQDL
jgi:hypothetical protein